MARRTRLAVLFGGRSSEHPVSVLSAASVLAALDRERYDVTCVGITRAGAWVLPGPDQRFLVGDGPLPEVVAGTALAVPGGPRLVAAEPGQPQRVLGEVDVVLPLLHGAWGEDGTVQGLLELAGVPYVGSGVFACAAAMDKAHAKTLLAAAGLLVGPHVVLGRGEDPQRGAIGEAVRALGLPVFVKPARAGSSVGITRVDAWSELAAAVAEARRHDPKVLLEQGVPGRELEVGVLGGLGGGPPRASVAAEIRVSGGQALYDFDAKYLDPSTRIDVPAALTAAELAEVQGLALRAFSALDCAGLARVDFFLTPEGRWLVNELNTMPGFTATSVFPRVWEASGVAYPALLDRLIDLAMEAGTGLR